MRPSQLARLIAGGNRSAARDDDSQRRKQDTLCDVDSATETAPASDAERTTTANSEGSHVANDDA